MSSLPSLCNCCCALSLSVHLPLAHKSCSPRVHVPQFQLTHLNLPCCPAISTLTHSARFTRSMRHSGEFDLDPSPPLLPIQHLHVCLHQLISWRARLSQKFAETKVRAGQFNGFLCLYLGQQWYLLKNTRQVNATSLANPSDEHGSSEAREGDQCESCVWEKCAVHEARLTEVLQQLLGGVAKSPKDCTEPVTCQSRDRCWSW